MTPYYQRQFTQSLTIEGWRGINHSFALVNQFQLLELVKYTNLTLSHADVPFHFPHWNQATNGAGFHSVDETILSQISTPTHETSSGWTFRIHSPVNLTPPATGGKLAVFLVTELGLDENTFSKGSDITQFQAAGGIIITPSNWSRNLIIDWGFHPDNVHVISHGASKDYFFPLPNETIKLQRAALSFPENEILLLNIGAAIWNKGIDILLKGFATARQQRKDIRLVFKDQRNTYGISGETYIQSTLSNAGLLSDDVLKAITLIPANLTMDQMNAMYGIADCYVSPYRAEGFNLPVCEAMACGTPVIATAGGATDDFISNSTHQKIESKLYKNTVVQGNKRCSYREPELEHLIEILINIKPKNTDLSSMSKISNDSLEWQLPVNQLLSLLT
ncbi:MAG: glycosyltransferase family 4 protein [Formivibrio sp.]|nr:glycosyltransferase family 4 protein [Formivibrio sp.]